MCEEGNWTVLLFGQRTFPVPFIYFCDEDVYRFDRMYIWPLCVSKIG